MPFSPTNYGCSTIILYCSGVFLSAHPALEYISPAHPALEYISPAHLALECARTSALPTLLWISAHPALECARTSALPTLLWSVPHIPPLFLQIIPLTWSVVVRFLSEVKVIPGLQQEIRKLAMAHANPMHKKKRGP